MFAIRTISTEYAFFWAESLSRGSYRHITPPRRVPTIVREEIDGGSLFEDATGAKEGCTGREAHAEEGKDCCTVMTGEAW